MGGRRSGFWLIVRACREAMILRYAVQWVEILFSVLALSILAELPFTLSHWLVFVWIENS